MVEHIKKKFKDTDVIVGLESRGFLFGSALAIELQLPFVPIRKKGKLPGELSSVTYELEYGSDTFEIQRDSIKPKQRVLIIDDLLATGGSLGAATKLIEQTEGVVFGCLLVIELIELKGRDKINYPVVSLIEF